MSIASKDPREPETQNGGLRKEYTAAGNASCSPTWTSPAASGFLGPPCRGVPKTCHFVWSGAGRVGTTFFSKTSLRCVRRLRSLLRVLVGYSVALRSKAVPATPAHPTSMALCAIDFTLADAPPRESSSRWPWTATVQESSRPCLTPPAVPPGVPPMSSQGTDPAAQKAEMTAGFPIPIPPGGGRGSGIITIFTKGTPQIFTANVFLAPLISEPVSAMKLMGHCLCARHVLRALMASATESSPRPSWGSRRCLNLPTILKLVRDRIWSLSSNPCLQSWGHALLPGFR